MESGSLEYRERWGINQNVDLMRSCSNYYTTLSLLFGIILDQVRHQSTPAYNASI